MSAVSDRTPNPSGSPRAAGTRPARRGPGSILATARARWNAAELFTAPRRDEWPQALRRLRTVGFVLLAVEFLVWAWWSALLVNRSSLTWDYSLYEQPVYLIAHGHLNPYSSTFGFPFWQNDGEFIFWPAAIFERIWPHLVTLKWTQDLAVIAAEALAFTWMCEFAARWNARFGEVRVAVALAGLGLLMLLADPWLTWAISFDAHAEPFILVFVVAAARDFYRGRRRAWIWVAFVLSGGAVPSTYAGALGLGLAVSGRRWWRQGLALAVIGFGWESVLHTLNAAHGAGIGGLYWHIIGYKGPAAASTKATLGTLVTAIIHHPGRALSALWTNKTDMWATVAPLGTIGVLWPLALVPSFVVLAEGGLTQGFVFSFPGFQNAVLAPLVAVGTVVALLGLASRTRQRRRWLPWLAAGLLAANAVVWAAIWYPQTSAKWLRVPAASASVLSKLRSRIPAGAEVIGQQGIVGAFADRTYVYSMLTSNVTIPAKTSHVYVVLAPEVGIETARVSGILSDVRELSADHHFRLVASGHDVWGFEWTRPPGVHSITIGQKGFRYLVSYGSKDWKAALGLQPVVPVAAQIAAWTVPGASGRVVKTGPPANWFATNNGQTGYVVAHAYWLEPPGTYTASVTLSTSAHANVEVWDATSSTLLARRVLTSTHGRTTLRMRVRIPRVTKPNLFGGWGIWAVRPHQPLAGDDLEVRVWTAARPSSVDVYSAGVS